jgi:hypothetical protein
MKETIERRVRVGLTRNARSVFDEIESVASKLLRDGWQLRETCFEDGLEYAHLFFERDITEGAPVNDSDYIG